MAGTDASNAVNVDSSAVVRSWPMILGLLTDGSDLSEADSRWAMGEIMSDNATSAQIAAFGVGLKMKGETPAELEGLAAAMLGDPRLNTVALGPGGGVGAPMREMVLAALQGERAVVLDADALTSFAEAPAMLFAAIKARGGSPTVLTPHEGEFARLFSSGPEPSENKSKCDRAQAAAE